MSNKPGLSILIPWYQREEIRYTLAANSAFFRAHSAEVLVVNCGGESARLGELILGFEGACIRQLDLSARFNKSLALNIGISQARSDHILTLDTDIVLLDDSLGTPEGCLHEQSFVTIEWVHESRPPAPTGNPLALAGSLGATLVNTTILEFEFPDGTKVHYQASRRDALGCKRAGPGILLAHKADLVAVKGYNSSLETWGWEDDDILVRLQYALKLRRIQRGEALHLTHGDDQRTLHGRRGRSDQLNFFKCCRNYDSGQFLGTFDSDIAASTGHIVEQVVNAAGALQRDVECPATQTVQFSGPADCGNTNDIQDKKALGWETRPPSISELLLEADLLSSPLQDYNLLHVGIGNSRLAARLSARCRHITGIATDELEWTRGTRLGLANYQPVIVSQRAGDLGSHLPLKAYDVIIASDSVSQMCCLRHAKQWMDNCLVLLAPEGRILTVCPDPLSASTSNWAAKEDDLRYLAAEFDLGLAKTAYDVYVLRSRGRR